MLVRPVNLNLSKSGEREFFYLKSRDILAETEHFKIAKRNGLQAIFLLFELVSSSLEIFWVLLIYWIINVGIFIHILRRDIMSICKHESVIGPYA